MLSLLPSSESVDLNCLGESAESLNYITFGEEGEGMVSRVFASEKSFVCESLKNDGEMNFYLFEVVFYAFTES